MANCRPTMYRPLLTCNEPLTAELYTTTVVAILTHRSSPACRVEGIFQQFSARRSISSSRYTQWRGVIYLYKPSSVVFQTTTTTPIVFRWSENIPSRLPCSPSTWTYTELWGVWPTCAHFWAHYSTMTFAGEEIEIDLASTLLKSHDDYNSVRTIW